MTCTSSSWFAYATRDRRFYLAVRYHSSCLAATTACTHHQTFGLVSPGERAAVGFDTELHHRVSEHGQRPALLTCHPNAARLLCTPQPIGAPRARSDERPSSTGWPPGKWPPRSLLRCRRTTPVPSTLGVYNKSVTEHDRLDRMPQPAHERPLSCANCDQPIPASHLATQLFAATLLFSGDPFCYP